jgi:hypothetical protein
MRTSLSLKSVATAYLLGGVWIVAMLGVAASAMKPMSGFYESIAIEIPMVAAVGTTALAILAANLVTAVALVALRRARSPHEEISHA